MSNSSTSLPVILEILKQFGQMSGYKLNLGKSESFAINNPIGKFPSHVAPFKWVDQGFKYLGIFITRSLANTFNNNFVPFKKVEDDFNRWSTLPLSLAGRVNLIKMTILPKFLYLFQHIPVLISKKFFAKVDKFLIFFGEINQCAYGKTYCSCLKGLGGWPSSIFYITTGLLTFKNSYTGHVKPWPIGQPGSK